MGGGGREYIGDKWYGKNTIKNKLLKINKGGRLGGRGIEQKGERTHGHGQQCEDCRREGSIRGLNGNGKVK